MLFDLSPLVYVLLIVPLVSPHDPSQLLNPLVGNPWLGFHRIWVSNGCVNTTSCFYLKSYDMSVLCSQLVCAAPKMLCYFRFKLRLEVLQGSTWILQDMVIIHWLCQVPFRGKPNV